MTLNGSGKKLNTLNLKFKYLKVQILNKKLEYETFKKYFISIKTQLKDIHVSFFNIFSLKKKKSLEFKLINLSKIKNILDNQLKNKDLETSLDYLLEHHIDLVINL